MGLTRVEESKVMPILWRQEIYYSNDVIEQYNMIIKKCCRAAIPFLEFEDMLSFKDLDYGLHSNSKRHKKMFEKIKQFLIDKK